LRLFTYLYLTVHPVPKIRKPTEADISAVFSNDVVVRKIRNQTVISTITVPRKSTSARKQEANKRFAKASLWAKVILTEPGMMELYSKGINRKLSNAHTVAVVDFLNAPEVHYISLKQHTGAIGDKIRIKATDDFQVTAVEVTITDKNGKQLEKGPAIRYKRKPVMWIYTLTVANPDIGGTVIEVTARDRPGNTVVKKETIESNL
jgi:hypothetical protein